MTANHGVRPASREDIPKAVETLGRAFSDYAFTRHTISSVDHVERVKQFQELFLSRIGLDLGKVWVTDDGDAVAVWTTPAMTNAGAVFAELAPRFTELSGDRAEIREKAEAAMQRHRPVEPVWFLGTVGVNPDRQGAGLGSAVIRPGLAAADNDGVAAFLETSDERNVRFYERLGFAVTADYVLPDGGPRTWAMTRTPNS